MPNHSLALTTLLRILWGTGGDGQNTINISTASAIVAASMGAKVAKHGNRSVSSKSGASDVLTALGVNVNVTPEQARQALDDIGVCFLFAQQYHSGLNMLPLFVRH